VTTITTAIKSMRLYAQNHLRGTILGNALVASLKKIGVNDWFTRILYAQDRKCPTPGMLYAKKYFDTHQKQLAEVESLLADELSKQVYRAAIVYRQTHHPKDVPFYSKNDQYFVKELVPLSEEEIFVDCGAFDGDTMQAFQKAVKNKYRRIICFEPVDEYHKRLQKRGEASKVTAICAGVYKETTTLHFNADDGKGSAITANTESTSQLVPVCAIDDVAECKDATFIKMDVEGAELDALKGARETILRNKPKLAICIYHMQRDFIEIPLWIHQLVPEYRLYIRHHSFSINETVLYAIPPQYK